MEAITLLAEVLKYIVPALIVFFAVKYMNDTQLKKEALKERQNAGKSLMTHSLPLRFTAHERAILFLERISPENLLTRVSSLDKGTRQFQAELLQEIRSEYEHNLSQQLYISNISWQALINAKESLANTINTLAGEMGEDADGISLARAVIERYSEIEENPIRNAIILLKRDLFRFSPL